MYYEMITFHDDRYMRIVECSNNYAALKCVNPSTYNMTYSSFTTDRKRENVLLTTAQAVDHTKQLCFF